MALRISCGPRMNHLRRPNVLISSSTGFDSVFGIGALSDNRTDLAGKFGSLTTDPTVTLDKNQTLNGNLNSWSGGAPVSWTVSTSGTGTVTETVVGGEVVSGSAAKCTAGSGFAAILQDIEVAPGDVVRVQGQMRGDGTNNAQVQVQNLQTGKYLTAGMAWSASNSVCATRSSSSYGIITLDFTVEDFLACGGLDSVQLRLILIGTVAAGIAYFDDWTAWVITTMVSVHGHNIDPLTTVQWRESIDNFSGSDVLVTAMSLQRPSFYAIGNALNRYQRLKFVGTQSTRSGAIWLGEWFVGQSLALATGPEFGFLSGFSFPQDRAASRAGRKLSLPLSESERRSAELRFRHLSLAAYQETRDKVFRRSFGGHHPAVLVLNDTDPEDVRFGYVSEAFPVTFVALNAWDSGIRHDEEPFPIMAP